MSKHIILEIVHIMNQFVHKDDDVIYIAYSIYRYLLAKLNSTYRTNIGIIDFAFFANDAKFECLMQSIK